ncbi:MAG: hypothetical protein KC502_07355 [Myxococcales bacterium]|nr:hypothetical protein [Myxococcales bacterium]
MWVPSPQFGGKASTKVSSAQLSLWVAAVIGWAREKVDKPPQSTLRKRSSRQRLAGKQAHQCGSPAQFRSVWRPRGTKIAARFAVAENHCDIKAGWSDRLVLQ